jgi:uncharacterized protein YndB with AHSA1/START domain
MNEGTLVIKKIFDAAPAVVWEAWVDESQVAQWYGPEGFTNTIHEFDAREGGTYRLTMHGPKGEHHPLRGMFKTLERPKKLVMTWQWEGDGMGTEETVVTVEFREVGGKTEMTMTHELPNAKSRDMHEMGWASSFNKLEKLFA